MKKHVFDFNLLKIQAMKMMKFWLVVLLVLASLSVQGQGWMRVYGEEEPLGAAYLSNYPKLIKTTDNHNLMLGFKYSTDGFTPDSAALVKVDGNGNEAWTRILDQFNDWYPSDIIPIEGGGSILCGYRIGGITIAKVNESGNIVWEKTHQSEGAVGAITAAPDGGYLIVGQVHVGNQANGLALKVDADGEFQWEKLYPFTGDYVLLSDVEPALDGGFAIVGWHGTAIGNEYFLLKIDATGNLIWTKTALGGAEKLIPLPDGGFFVAGWHASKYDNNGNEQWVVPLNIAITGVSRTSSGDFLLSGGIASTDIYLEKLNSEGQFQWVKAYGSPIAQEGGGGLVVNDDGTIIVSGKRYDELGNKNGLLLLKTDSLGNLFTSALSGTVHQDPESDCLPDPTEPGLSGWLVQATGALSFATLTDTLGHFTLPVDTGSYEVTITPPVPYWEACNSPFPVSVTEFYDTLSLDFPAQAAVDCPYLTVDISAPFLRRCFDNNYYVHYCNDGTIAAEDATVEVTLDPYFTYVSSTIPLTSQNGNVLAFNLGDVAVNDCGSFHITAYLSCDSTILGQAHCTSAHISPDSLCLPPDPLWDGSSIETDVSCNGDSVTFIITNVGSGTMPAPLGYIIIEDQIVLMSDEFQLEPGQSTTVTLPANGSTFRLEAQQASGHPSGFASTGATIEGCGGWLSIGFFTQWAFDDDPDPFTNVDCQANIGSYDPNDKQGFPNGLGEEHLIEPGQDLEYLIRFQNTGTDTAFKVVIVDVLPPELDLSTVRPGASSHAYTYGVTPEGWLTFTFDDIMLPDSNVNEPASHGFVRFRASQVPGLGHGDVIANTALIYFDFNAPIQTNTYRHKIGQVNPWTLVGTTPPVFQQKTRVKVVPNPLTDGALLQVEGIEPGPLRLVLTDVSGKVLRQQTTQGTGFEFQRGELNPGLYFFQIERNGERVGSGKLMVR
jgi:uncharacterized repeat protein (TIGR01451 family)